MPSEPPNSVPLQQEHEDAQFFKKMNGRTFNVLNETYLLPADQDEVKRSELHHRMMQFVFNGKNYIGPVKEALQFGEQRRILDLGTGGGFWYTSTLASEDTKRSYTANRRAINMADDFPRAEVIGVDLAPIQPRSVPPNCTFELCDLDDWNIPYPDCQFDFIHARSLHTGIHDYPRFLEEIARLLRPGGLALFIEPSIIPIADERQATEYSNIEHPVHGWFTFWETYGACLRSKGIDTTIPSRIHELLAANDSFERVVAQDTVLPVGFWPTDPHLLTIGQLQWMDYELFLPAVKTMFLSCGLSESNAARIIEGAQRDLYYPPVRLSAKLHIVYASKRPG